MLVGFKCDDFAVVGPREIYAAAHNTDRNGSVTTIPKRDRGITYNLRRLQRDRPDLFERVAQGELSANAAAIEAGFRKRMVQVEPTLEGFQRAIERHLKAGRLVTYW